jgi:hypothetical protein
MVNHIIGGDSSATDLIDKYDKPSEITCICFAELEVELEKTRTELRTTQKIIELQRGNNMCCALCANVSSNGMQRPSGSHQLNKVLNKDNHTQKDKSDKRIKE